jgi:micrococcal nuclease
MEPCYRYRARLGRVVDGDTIDVLIELGFYVTLRERVRLEGIDTPEIYRVPKDSEEYNYLKDADKTLNDELVEKGLAKIAR